jgi:hypothetical protein
VIKPEMYSSEVVIGVMFMRWLVVFASVIVCSVVEVNDSDIVLITLSVISVFVIK